MDAIRYGLLVASLMLLQACGEQGSIVRIGDRSLDIKQTFSDPHVRALARAAARGDTAAMDRQIADGVNVNATGKDNVTPLWWAAASGNCEGFAGLLKRGANANASRTGGLSIMTLVTLNEKADLLDLALKHGGDPNFRDGSGGETPIFAAIRYGRYSQLEMLLRSGADVNVQSKGGWTAMTEAIGSGGDYKTVLRLLELGADPTLKLTNGKSLADIIALRAIDPNSEAYIWREKVLAILRQKGIEVSRPSHEGSRRSEEPDKSTKGR